MARGSFGYGGSTFFTGGMLADQPGELRHL